MDKANRITIICGHYGSGKTNLALNLALESAKDDNVTLVDMDIVNPYFRSSEYGELLSNFDIELIAPTFANTTQDTPTLPPEVSSIFVPNDKMVLVDAGGDDAGIIALRGMSDRIKQNGYEMIYVINENRVQSKSPEKALELLKEIEIASGLKATGIVNNTHLGVETTKEIVLKSIDFAKETSKLANIPLLYTTIPEFAVIDKDSFKEKHKEVKIIKRLVKFPWEREDD